MTGPDLDGTSLASALRSLEDEGYQGQFVVERDGPIRCTHCGTKSPPDDLPMLAHRRIEGASDPADEILIAGVQCPSCGTRGTLLLPYGARALRQEAKALSHMHRPGEPLGHS